MVKGIGPIFAKRMVERFGADILSVIEHRSGELVTVEGIGPKRRLRIKQAWEEIPRKGNAPWDVVYRKLRRRSSGLPRSQRLKRA
ncbi:hypothetical protein SBA6_1160004 [Candidatus Sulfopaludibacter sp. SbA6]|nr:hypothetical protein SBA6_1160004 [Candidatus Sulfopaludibacter sp. SbA6]